VNNSQIKLIVGLGNVGSDYEGTRHNLGFYCLDRLAGAFRATWQDKPRFKALVTEQRMHDQKVILAKPTTFYNLSGEAVNALATFYKIPTADILVIHDELDLPFGKIRTRIAGSDAGNNGIKNITSHLGSAFARIRIGIDNDQTVYRDAADFVLDYFLPQEQQVLPRIAEHVLQFTDEFVSEDKDFLHTSVQVL